MNWLELLPHCEQQSLVISHYNNQQITLSKASWQAEANKLAEVFTKLSGQSVAFQVDNTPPWLILDSLLSELEKVAIPLPVFFTPQQVQHSLTSSGATIFISDRQYTAENAQLVATVSVCQCFVLFFYQLTVQTSVEYFAHTNKITFTSGSTGSPKGVCLSLASQLQVATSLHQQIGIDKPKHLCLLPLPVLLENIAGVYAPLLAAGSVHLMALNELGFQGSQLAQPAQLIAAIDKVAPNTLILVPELLSCLVQFAKQGWQPPASLKFIAVGGAVVSSQLIAQARQLGLPVYQGYGLSEAASVVSLNTPNDDLFSCAGRVLPHLETTIRDGQLFIKGPLFLGYLGQAAQQPQQWYATGDLVVEQQGRLTIQGRLKNQLITSFGRNISAEWPESLLLSHSAVLQAVVVGEGRPYLSALIYATEQLSTEQLHAHVTAINQQLPDYAQIKHWHRLVEPLTYQSGLLTNNNRAKRDAINHFYRQQIAALYPCEEVL
ncbi:AMP-binding protein [Pseudoalteromonas sp.]|uniref:AMP-binding protein n=1 Tax=Pseudoalteromonas sp. TaxID=53249 RepID=UPI0030028D70